VAEAAGADYIGCANTMQGRVLRNGRPILAGGSGGVSGKRLKETNLSVVHDVRTAIDPLKTGIVAYGGIESAQDVIDYLMEGAEIFGLGTAFMYMETDEAVRYTQVLAKNLEIWLKDHGTTLEKLRGSAHA
jgi:dihydroorotate dehydrogenase (NAD+) catalytic subunit